ncbi:MAG: phosphoribosylglycinamide formyltransferase [Planctomycetes bacterium]|nr:phosphoribosylglycinamide formyltransferase [Planctomycetota bacterium]
MAGPLRLAVLLSGSGRTLQNLLDQIADRRLAARIVAVIGSRPDAYGLERARRAGLPACCVHRKRFPDAAAFSRAIDDALRPFPFDLLVMAGFLHYYEIPAALAGRILNIHPSLLPAFGGAGCYGGHVHRAVLASGARVSGCTVHFVDQQFDHGPIVLQRTVEVRDDDTPDTLAARVFAEECIALPEAIGLFAAGRLRIEGRRVRHLPAPGAAASETGPGGADPEPHFSCN